MSTTGSNGDRPAGLLVQGQVTDREGFKACNAALPPLFHKYEDRFSVTVLGGLPGAG